MRWIKPACVLFVLIVVAPPARATPTLLTLLNFAGTSNGANPQAPLTTDAAGNLYGTTKLGGSKGYGTVFQLAAGTRAYSTLTAFDYTNTGAYPLGRVISDAAGNLYGTTSGGPLPYQGTVYQLAPVTHALTTLHSFGPTAGSGASLGLTSDAAGNLYGSTGDGTVFQMDAGTRAFHTLGVFPDSGASPNGNVVVDSSGNLYGTTYGGGVYDGVSGYGTVFKLAAGSHALSRVALPDYSVSGQQPTDGLVADAAGNLYGTASYGGPANKGTVFKVDAATGALAALASFDSTTGANPTSALLLDASGNLFGTTKSGGAGGYGTVFELSAGSNAITTLLSFTNANGANPVAGLLADSAGNLYGTTSNGGASGKGTVFEITNSGFAVPEPTALSLLAVIPLLLGRRRKDVPHN